MELSFFTMPIHPVGKPVAQSLREDREAFILADKLGYKNARSALLLCLFHHVWKHSMF